MLTGAKQIRFRDILSSQYTSLAVTILTKRRRSREMGTETGTETRTEQKSKSEVKVHKLRMRHAVGGVNVP